MLSRINQDALAKCFQGTDSIAISLKWLILTVKGRLQRYREKPHLHVKNTFTAKLHNPLYCACAEITWYSLTSTRVIHCTDTYRITYARLGRSSAFFCAFGMNSDDVAYSPLPLYHSAALLIFCGSSLLMGE